MEQITTNIVLAVLSSFLTFWGLIDKFFIKPKIQLLEGKISNLEQTSDERISSLEQIIDNRIKNLKQLAEEKIAKIEHNDKMHYEQNAVQLVQLQKSIDNVNNTMKDVTALLATNTAFLRLLQDNLQISIGEGLNAKK